MGVMICLGQGGLRSLSASSLVVSLVSGEHCGNWGNRGCMMEREEWKMSIQVYIQPVVCILLRVKSVQHPNM